MKNDSSLQTEKHIYTVSELNISARMLLEQHFGTIWIEGEISNLSKPNSGHWYFSLKDENAQVRCAMFRTYNQNLKFLPEDGMHVLVRARVSLYENRGDFQLIVEQLEDIGFGALQRAFEQLKIKLEKQGLFDIKHKKPIPAFPQCIGVITSPTGAAIKDILSVLERRYPLAPVIIYPTQVQGDKAAKQIHDAIKIANDHKACDVLILARGGGSLEDLWPFNEEIVALAVYQSLIPIVSGIGHEVDFTIADFVADNRAPTPSAAAELVSPNQEELLVSLKQMQQRLNVNIKKSIQNISSDFKSLQKRLKQCDPTLKLHQQSQTLDRLTISLKHAETHLLAQKKSQLQSSSHKIHQLNPIHQLKQHQLNVSAFQKTLLQAIQQALTQKNHQFIQYANKLESLSPLNTLKRGYAVVTNEKNQLIKDSQNVKIGDKITTRLAKGQLKCLVKEVD